MSNSPMTAFAQAALAVSDLLAAKFAATKFGGSVPRVVKVQAPQGPSTSGGKKARESIVLMPESGDSSQAVTAGFIDVGLRAVELRTFEAVAAPYSERFGRALDLPKPEYDKFVADLKGFLGGEGYVIKMVDADAAAAKAARVQQAEEAASPSSGPPMGVVVAGVVAVVVLGAVAFILLK